MAVKNINRKKCSVCGTYIPVHSQNDLCIEHGGNYTAKDCFAYLFDGQCAALNDMYCKCEKCNFYKKAGK